MEFIGPFKDNNSNYTSKIKDSKYLQGNCNIVKEIENLHIEHKYNDVSNYVTISAGLIILPSEKIKDSKQLYQYADEALYNAKNQGRNKLVVSSKSL